MAPRKHHRVILGLLVAALAAPAGAQVVQERFNTVTGTGGGQFFSGSGFRAIAGWDTGIAGESAFAGTAGNAHVAGVSALGVPNGGVGSTGAGRIAVSGATFNIRDETFDTATGTGGVTFLAGGAGPNTSGYTLNFDDGLLGEGAFGGTQGGANLIGGMSAAGVPGGGLSGTGAAQLTVSNVDVTTGSWYAGLQWSTGPLPGASPFYNGGFDDNGGSFAHWTKFNNAYIEHITPHSGGSLLKMYGNWSGPWNASGAYQDIAAVEGQTWRLDCFSRHNAGDSLVGTQNYVVMKLEFWSVAGAKIFEQETRVLDANSPLNTWIDNPPLDIVAPAGTSRVRAVIVFLQPASQSGAGFVDTVLCRPIAGPSGVDLSAFTLSAALKGTISAAGETLGDLQLRMEDTDGNRLLFRTQANGAWQALGGPLSAAIEADAQGIPTPGAFNRHSPSFTLVAAFDDESTHRWGRGGTLTVDNLLLGNTDSTGSDWMAGLYWDNLTLPKTDPRLLFLSADVLGSKVGGRYALRLEGLRIGSAGLNEAFDTVTGQGGGLFLDRVAYDAGARFGSITNWDNGVEGETAYGGLAGNAVIYDDGLNTYGFSARGLPVGGTSGTGAGEIRVEGIEYGPGGGWYAGLTWPAQGLASTNLSQVTLSASIKGSAASGGTLGQYELRIEDAQGDRMYFLATATGAWQQIGGPLSTAQQGAALSGNGDGVFNLDSPTYTVVVSFRDETATWQYGGALAVDNLFLTAVTTRQELGQLSFAGTGGGGFKKTGGLLSTGANTFPNDIDESFNTVTGEGGGAFLVAGQGNGATDGWDTGIVRENAFAGVWGDAVVVGSVSAYGCLTCGVGGGGAGVLMVDNIQPNTSGWWAGVDWPNVKPDMTDLAAIRMEADILATVDAGAGQFYGPIQLRLEDDGLDYLAFEFTPTGAWQHIGGPLTTATVGSIPGGDGAFNYNAASYTLTIVFSGSPTAWGTGGTVVFDNVFLTGLKLGDADNFTVTLAFEDEIATWGTDGALTVDNLLFVAAPNCQLDGDVDVADLATFQKCYSGNGTPPAGCDCADLNGDGKVNAADLALVPLTLAGPQ